MIACTLTRPVVPGGPHRERVAEAIRLARLEQALARDQALLEPGEHAVGDLVGAEATYRGRRPVDGGVEPCVKHDRLRTAGQPHEPASARDEDRRRRPGANGELAPDHGEQQRVPAQGLEHAVEQDGLGTVVVAHSEPELAVHHGSQPLRLSHRLELGDAEQPTGAVVEERVARGRIESAELSREGERQLAGSRATVGRELAETGGVGT